MKTRNTLIITINKSTETYQGQLNNPDKVMFKYIRKYDQHEGVGPVSMDK